MAAAAQVHDYARQALPASECHPFDALFNPRTVAVIGASEKPGSVGCQVLRNLLSSPFGGTFYPVNPNRKNLMGIRTYPTIAAVSQAVDLAIIATPAASVPDVISECVADGVRAAIVLSSGFRESGPEGLRLEMEIKERLQGGSMRVIGPNSLGVMNPIDGLNATCAPVIARSGSVAFLSESGTICRAILDWSRREVVGFSAFVSLGSMLDVGWGDLIDYFGDQTRTKSIVCYMQSIGRARAFVSAAREVSRSKPIIVVKAGRSESGAKAAESHTGALAGSEEAMDAAFRRCGVLRVNDISELFYMSDVLAKQPRPQGNRLAIVTNSGAAAVMAADKLTATGGTLAQLTPHSTAALNSLLPPASSNSNPIRISPAAEPQQFAKAVEIVAADPNCDGLLVIATPEEATSSAAIAEQLTPYAKATAKPVLASFMGGDEVAAADEILNFAGIPTFPFPEAAARAFTYMWRYSYNLRGLYETPVIRDAADPDRRAADQMVCEMRQAGRTVLSEYESKRLLAAYRIPVVDTRTAATVEEAVAMAEAVGFPVVLKVNSRTIVHKSEAGGVQLCIPNPERVREAFRAIRENVSRRCGDGAFLGVTVQPMIVNENGYELIIGSRIDAQFGPVLVFGAGGRMVNVYQDRALALPPLNTTLARRLMEQTKVFTALKGIPDRRGADLEQLEQLLVRFSQLVVEQPWIKEIDMNPLLASPGRLLALDARVILHGPEMSEEELPRSIIRPYPLQYIAQCKLKDGAPVTIRPIHPEDEPLMVRFHEALSERSVYLRYFHPVKLSERIKHEQLTRICFLDYDREMALVAVRKVPVTGQDEIIAVGLLTKSHDGREAECAVTVLDKLQRLGLGTELMEHLLAVARAEGAERVIGSLLAENVPMRAICRRLGFHLELDREDQTVGAEITP